ncbi:MAG: 3-deoxy-manno-octulosonate cytidylyltransferase [Proteobacteria bacterium]|nr:3-deoxy-manno-octulosonate cytidylyltransferase [Pseudomonadota bacterium]
MSQIVVIIPARLGATRLPNKPLAEIAGIPMVIRAAQCAAEANVGDVIIACGEQEIVDVADRYGFKAVLTDPALPSGTDRVFAAYKALHLKHPYILNLQGDLPLISPKTIQAVAKLIAAGGCDISTAAAVIDEPSQIDNPSVVKIALTADHRALYFSRATIPQGAKEYLHHIGVYAYTTNTLARFVSLPPSQLELQERLEQLRIMEDGAVIKVAMVEQAPISVDTHEDLQRARAAAVAA